jgi:hypothetical protein
MTDQKKIPVTEEELPSPQDFCVSVPLYETFKFNKTRKPFYELEYFKKSIDLYCPECGTHSVFIRTNLPQYWDKGPSYNYNNYTFTLDFKCSRNENHKAFFLFLAHKDELQKIGQSPSLADISIPDLRKYRAILKDDNFRELTRGIGLYSHGVGIGAFVYLRRIFELLIKYAHSDAKKDPEWIEEDYVRSSRMDEKISMLKDHLPEFLVQNKSLYGILSIGVHTLNEKECLSAFPVVRLAIELILDESLKKHERQSKINAATNSLTELKSVINKPKD